MEKQILQHIAENYRAKYGQNLTVKTTKQLGGGCINNALMLETNLGKLFLKWNSNGPGDMFIREAESLNEFKKSNNEFIVFPEPLASKSIDSTPGYLLTTFLEAGHSGNDDEKLGRGLAQLHNVTAEQFGFAHNNYCGSTLQDNSHKTQWIDFYCENRIAHIVKLIRKQRNWDSNDEKTSESFLQKVPSIIQHNPKPALIHGDLWSGNYMYTSQGPAIIDPCVSYCDREFEMGIMTMFGGFSQTVYNAYNEYSPLPNGWRERNLIYQLYHVLNHYYLFGGHYKKQALDIMKRYI